MLTAKAENISTKIMDMISAAPRRLWRIIPLVSFILAAGKAPFRSDLKIYTPIA